MADIYTKQDLIKLLENKHILFIGDHNIRNVYKDFICLYQTNELMKLDHIGRNLEESYLGDSLVYRRNMYKERRYAESRIFKGDEVTFEYIFISQCCSPILSQYLCDIFSGTISAPDVIYMNSFLWDFTRWGPKPEGKYVKNMYSFVQLLKQCLPDTTLFIWATTSPVSMDPKDIPFVPQLSQVNETMYSDIIEANHFAAELFRFHGYDVIDTYYHLFTHADRRSLDGVRYNPCAVRYVTYLLLTHIALSWDVTLPGRVDGLALHEEISRSKEKYSTEKVDTHWYEPSHVKTLNNAGITNTSVTNNYRKFIDSFNTKLQLNSAINSPAESNKPVIRVKATWEVLKEFGESSTGLNMLTNKFAGKLSEENQEDGLEPISSSEHYSESDGGECCSVNSFVSNIKSENTNITNIDERKPLLEERNGLISFNKVSNRNSSKERKIDLDEISNMDELEEGEISSDNSVASDTNIDVKSKFVKFNSTRDVKNTEDNKKILSNYNQKYLKVNDELEEGEIDEADEIEEEEDLRAARNWRQWKRINQNQFILNSDKDLVTLEIDKTRRSNRVWLNTTDYRRLINRRDGNSLYRIEGFLNQLKRTLMPLKKKRYNKRSKTNDKNLLFGYEKNERSELFQPRILSNSNENESNDNAEEEGGRKKKSIGWVADQWRRVIERENEESVEELSLWQRDNQSIKQALKMIRQKSEEKLEAFYRADKNGNMSISFL